MRGLVWNQEVPEKCKKVLFSMYYTPILTYAAGTWTTTKRDESRIQAAEMKFLRGIIGKTRRDKVRNVDIRERTGFPKLQDKIETSKLKWYGHMMRMEEYRVPKRIFMEKIPGRRPRGRPRKRWIDTVKESIEKTEVKEKEVLKERNERRRDRQL